MAYINKTRKLLAKNIIYWRTYNNWSQEEFAYKLNSSTLYISKMENCKRNITSDTIDRLSKVFKIEPHELLIDRPNVKSSRVDRK